MGALFALAIGASSMQAANLLNPAALTLTCQPTVGGSNGSITVAAVGTLTGTNILTVSLGTVPAGMTVTAPSPVVLSASVTSLTFHAVLTPASNTCSTFVPGTLTVPFKVIAGTVAAPGTTAVADASSTITTQLLTGVTASTTSVALTCAYDGANWYPGPSAIVNLTSTATAGAPFTTAAILAATGVKVSPSTGGTATASNTPLTFSVLPGCGGFLGGTSNPTTAVISNTTAGGTVTISISFRVITVLTSKLTFLPTAAAITYTKGSGTAGYQDVKITSTAASSLFFAIDTTTLPVWLNVDSTTGTAGTGANGKSVRFSSTSVADTLAPGLYTAAVNINVSGYSVSTLPVTLQINDPAPKLIVGGGSSQNVPWTVGQAAPTTSILLTSSGAPIPYSLKTAGTLSAIINAKETSGFAYSFGTSIPVSFDPLVFAAAAPGSTLTGTVTINYGSSNSIYVITYTTVVASPGATITSITPASVPTAVAGTIITVGISGTGFVASSDPTLKTKVGVMVGGVTFTPDTNFAVQVLNSSNLILTMTVPASDPNVPFGVGPSVMLGVCNPNPSTGACANAPATQVLSIGTKPLIQAVTSASTFVQTSTPTVAPFDVISIFGTNFCPICTSSQVMVGTPDTTYEIYPTSVSPTATVNAAQPLLTITFYKHSNTATLGAQLGTMSAPILFATNNQINLLVPSAVTAAAVASFGGMADIVVTFGPVASAVSSAPFPVTVAGVDPGIFTVGSNGTGSGAILDLNYSTIALTNPAGLRATATSDIVHVYMTGLGAPDAPGSTGYQLNCIATSAYLTSDGNAPTIDGAIIQGVYLTSPSLPPCVGTGNAITAKVGNVAATVIYAGWVPDSVAGLYQVDLTLPTTTASVFKDAGNNTVVLTGAPVDLPVLISAGGIASQKGVTISVAKKLGMTTVNPDNCGTDVTAWSCAVNVALDATINTTAGAIATEGTPGYTFVSTSMPPGLALAPSSGLITGTPTVTGTYTVQITAQDSTGTPVFGTLTFTITVH